MQDRIGANRAKIFGLKLLGLPHILCDAIKMFTKEDFVPAGADKFLHTLAPFLSVAFTLVAFAAIPFGPDAHLFGRVYSLQIANINVGLVYLFGMLSLAVYGVILSGLASNSNYAYLGSLRASSQMIAYEVTLGASIVGIVLIFSSLNLNEIVLGQGELLWGCIPKWGIVVQPLAFFLFVTAMIAESKRIPFDIPEGESEIVGYFVEYSGMKFGMFFLTDFLETILAAALTATLFLGGWQVPFLNAAGFQFPWGAIWSLPHLVVVALGVLSFIFKTLCLCWLFMTIRWTLPRFRYDQLMHLGWKIMLPLSLVNIVVTAVVLLVVGY
jgi:NADH-quinone oxidoreductase subunit H